MSLVGSVWCVWCECVCDLCVCVRVCLGVLRECVSVCMVYV